MQHLVSFGTCNYTHISLTQINREKEKARKRERERRK